MPTVAPHTGLPSNCTDIAPPDIPASHIAVFDPETETWSLNEDHHGETVYDTQTSNPIYISKPGPLAGRKTVKECIMSCFTTPAILEMPGHYLWRIHESFEFYLSDDNSDVISVPAGFVTDLATVPCIFWSVMPPDGKYAKAAIIHDYLYDNALRTKKEANLIFLDGMTVLGAPKWKRIEMYLAVR